MSTDPRTGTRFAVYLCPPAGSEYYRLGSETLGYDVRARREIPLPADILPEWQTQAGPYGFHLTLVEGFYCAPEALPELETELRALSLVTIGSAPRIFSFSHSTRQATSANKGVTVINGGFLSNTLAICTKKSR